MKKKEKKLEKEYNSMLANYNGKPKDGYDIYACTCGHKVATYKEVEGVTPFMIDCPKCGRHMMHGITVKEKPDYAEIRKWVRPNLQQTASLRSSLKDHVLLGGLMFDEDLKANRS